jgi:hypothetical protein
MGVIGNSPHGGFEVNAGQLVEHPQHVPRTYQGKEDVRQGHQRIQGQNFGHCGISSWLIDLAANALRPKV